VYRDIPDDLKALIEPVVEDHGFELVDVVVTRGAGVSAIRVTIDRAEGDGLVPVGDCAEVLREIESQLDASETFAESYGLEVSSPGLDRTLAREKDFSAACGEEVKIRTRRPLDGRRRFKGMLLDFKDGVACVEIDGCEVAIPFDEIEKANKLYKFSRADFATARQSGG
jgi:ribosome maturation factor RimP